MEDIEKIIHYNEEQKVTLLEQHNKVYEAQKNDALEPEEMVESIIHFGPSDPNAYSMKVPNESLAIIIGKNSDTLKMLENMTGV